MDEVIRNLQLAPLKPSRIPKFTVKADRDSQQAPVNSSMAPISNSLKLIDKLLSMNQMAPKLEELQVKARIKVKNTWQLQDRLLLKYSKLYVPNSPLMPEMLL